MWTARTAQSPPERPDRRGIGAVETRVRQAGPPCPFCSDALAIWPSGSPVTTCRSCRRPLVLLPASLVHRRYRIFSLVELTRIVMLPLVGGAIVAFVLGRVMPDTFARIVALTLLAYGVLDVWDGTAGIESGRDRVRRSIQNGRAARRVSIGKTVLGGASIALGAVGLLITS